MIEARKT